MSPLPAATGGRPRLADEASAYIKRLIVDRVLVPGERVPVDAVAAGIGTSRAPVREALVVLERAGWVTSRLHHGAVVNGFERETIVDHYTLLASFLGLAARRAMGRDAGTGGLADRLAAHVGSPRDPAAELRRAQRRFHREVLDTAASPRLRATLLAVSASVPDDHLSFVPEVSALGCRWRAEIHAAVRAGDEDRAAAAYEALVSEHSDLGVAFLEAAGLLDA